MDATKYIEDLKQKVDRLNQDIGASQFSADQNNQNNPLPVVFIACILIRFYYWILLGGRIEVAFCSFSCSLLQQVKVETLERGFLINVFWERNCPGLLVSILETFEELGLNVLDARVSCSDSFHLEAVGGEVRKITLFHLSHLTHVFKSERGACIYAWLHVCRRICLKFHHDRASVISIVS